MPSLNTGNAILSNAIAVNSSYNVGIGGAASGTFKLDVNGSVNLAGNVTTTGAQFVQNGFYLANANAGATAFYTNMWGADDGVQFALRNLTGGARFIFQSAASYNYTFPATTGTLALTSNLSAYLPLSGGTLTGALSGTSATFSDIITNTTGGFRTLASQGYILRNDANNGNLGGFTRRSYWAGGAALDTQIFAETGYGIFLNVNGSSTSGLTIASTGAATFSSSVTAKSSISVSNNGGENVILSAVSSFADGYRATLRLWNQHTGGKAWEVYSTNVADGAYGAGKLAFVNSTDSVTAMVMTSSGNVGIGTSSPAAWGGSYIALQMSNTGTFASNGTNGTVIGHNFYYDGTNDKYLTTGVASRIFQFQGNIRFELASSGSAGSNLSFSEAMRITSGGNVGVGNTGYSNIRFASRGADTSSSNWAMWAEDSNGTTILAARNDLQIYAGNIGTGTGTTLILTSGGYIQKQSSSIRYKKDVQPIDIGLDFILSLNPVSYLLKDGDIPQVGFIAEDFPEDRLVCMSMIDTQDESKGYQKESVNYAQIVAPLVKAIQELNQKVNEQQQTINSLINR